MKPVFCDAGKTDRLACAGPDRFALGARITWSHHCCLLYVFVVFDHFSISNIVRYKGKGKGFVK